MTLTAAQMLRRALLLQRLLALDDAKQSLLAFTRLTMPDPRDMDDVKRSLYEVAPLHQKLAEVLEQIESGKLKRVILTCPPRHGKTELATRHFMAWHMGRHPDRHLMFGTYNDTFAEENGRAVRDIVQSPQFRQVFPGFKLKPSSASVTRLETSEAAVISFAGRGSTFTGRGGHGLILDDPIKNDEEADSQLIRDKLWNWFNRTVTSRMMTQDAFILIIQTRWHEDDIVGRLLDPSNPYYNPEEAKDWTLIEFPALAGDNDPLGRQKGEALWPQRFGVKWLQEQQRRDPLAFQALYQGRPTPAEGVFFTTDCIHTYTQAELPKNLRYYVASDHAVATEQKHDKTAMIPVGLDQHGTIYVLEDVFWDKKPTDIVVEEMLKLMRRRNPIYWWAERGHITKSIGPFLRKRMLEEQVFTSVIQVQPSADKQQRAQSIRGRMAMGRVLFPSYARWWPDAKEQLLRFPGGANDDFVDALAYIGIGLTMQVGASAPRLSVTEPERGTFGYLMRQTQRQKLRDQTRADISGW